MHGKRASVAALVFFAFTMPFGIAAHLVSELAGLGWHDDADVIFSARHGYLLLVALATLGGLFAALAASPRSVRRARVTALIEALPFGGRGARFTLASFAAQFAFFALTQFGEGCPLCSGDLVVGVAAAAAAAALGALAVSLGKRRMLELALAVVHYLCLATFSRAVVRAARQERRAAPAPTRRRTPYAFRYRPPPVTIR